MRYLKVIPKRDKISRYKDTFPVIIRLLILIMALFIPNSQSIAHAQIPPEMKMNATPNPVGSGARALGIGGAFISIADDATAASWNPAGLIKLKRPEMSIVGSYFSGKREYDTSSVSGEINDLFNGQYRLNYFSAAFPFVFLARNMVFSVNYQHLFEFSENILYQWTESIPEALINREKTCSRKQKGALSTLSPALAVQVIPSLYIGMTANFWPDDSLNNYWENMKTVRGEGTALGEKKRSFAELYERYEFSGFNGHFGFLWHINSSLTLGGVVKTPFKADINQEFRYTSIADYPENMAENDYIFFSDTDQFKLNMPMSCGLGSSIRFSDNFLMSMDVYRTDWDDFLMYTPLGRISPINNEPEHKADIKPTIQVRLGAEYSVIGRRWLIPVRAGIFYDPEPAAGSADNFYGATLGTGIVFKKLSFDIAYQYRFGHKKWIEYMTNKKISSDVKQHYLYTSMIFYF